jgi:hypothetical protein
MLTLQFNFPSMAIDYSPTGQEFVTGSYARTVSSIVHCVKCFHNEWMEAVVVLN